MHIVHVRFVILNKKILFHILDEWFCEKHWISVGSRRKKIPNIFNNFLYPDIQSSFTLGD